MQQSNLNLIPSGDMPIVYASQYDKNRVIRFNLFDGDEEYTLSGTEIVKCNIRKNDEHIVVIIPTIGANTYIDVALTEQACACFGDNIGEITISDDEDTLIGTINFILKVERNPIQGGVTSASDIADLETQIEEIVHEVMSDDYYTRDEVDAKLALKANADDVYTKSQVDTALGLKADKSDTYTKTQVDNALALKADASSVYTKSEVDTALGLKADKSDTYTKTQVDAMIDALYPVNTVSGGIANFTCALVLPLVALKAFINYDANGVSELDLTRCRKNIFKNSLESQTYNGVIYTVNSDGSITLGGQATSETIRTFHFYLPAGSYIYTSGITEDYATYDTYITSGGSTIARGREGSNTFTLTQYSDLVYGIRVRNGVSPNITIKPMIRVSTDTDNTFEPYNADTFTIALDQTIYGGYVDYTENKLYSTKNADGTDKDTPDIYDLTGLPTITTIAGEQNIYCNSGDVSVTFKQDIQNYVDSKIGG